MTISFDYFALCGTEPLLVMRRGGLKCAGFRCDRATGALVLNNRVISLAETHPDVDEVSAVAFFRLLETYRSALRDAG